MRELGKACRIYCEKNHKKWPELIPYKLKYGRKAPWLFGELLPSVPEGEAESLTLEQKESRALARLKKRAEE
jgi:hypothetical protein